MKTKKYPTERITKETIEKRSGGKKPPKWLQFCDYFIERGYEVNVHYAHKTTSKYVYVKGSGKECKVRFSNHQPVYDNCDIYAEDLWGAIEKTKEVLGCMN